MRFLAGVSGISGPWFCIYLIVKNLAPAAASAKTADAG